MKEKTTNTAIFSFFVESQFAARQEVVIRR